MKFVDSNVFLHAILTPRRKLTVEEQKIKDEAKAILKRIEQDEEVATTTAHLSEVVNIIETGLNLQKSLGFLAWAIAKENVKVYPIAEQHYEKALPIAKESKISANDAIAYLCMETQGIMEIYSFDKHFEQFKDLTRLPQFH